MNRQAAKQLPASVNNAGVSGFCLYPAHSHSPASRRRQRFKKGYASWLTRTPPANWPTKPLGRLLLRFAIPSIFAQIVNLLYNIVDRIFVGRIPEIGPLALAGLGVAFPIILIISSFSFLAGMGGAPLASIAMGRGDNAKAERILGSACVFLLAMSVVLTVLCFWAMRPMLLMFGASEQTIGYAVDYFSLYLLGTPAVQLSLGLTTIFSCQALPRRA